MIGSITLLFFIRKKTGWQFIWQISGYNKTDGKFEIENESMVYKGNDTL
jgi:hypothetical protein